MTLRLERLAALFLIAVPVLFNLGFFLLQQTFSYPDILRQPAAEVLSRFAAGGTSLLATWYLFAMTPALFIVAALLFHHVWPVGSGISPWLALAKPLAVVAGLVQLLGLVRWPFLVPALAQQALDPASSEGVREAALVTFAAFNQYAGVAVGEHLGYLFTGLWTLLVAGTMLCGHRWLGGIGLIAGLGILVGMLEPAGVSLAGMINALAYVVWSLWLIGIGVTLWRRGASR